MPCGVRQPIVDITQPLLLSCLVGCVGLQDRVRMACEVASALVFLHSAPEPIIHMDLKPGGGPGGRGGQGRTGCGQGSTGCMWLKG